VFVVDDDASMRESLESLIGSAGWQAKTFASAQEFLLHPRLAAPSCVVLDISLPDINGLELQKRMAADRSRIPVIFVTGHGDVPTVVRAMKDGAVDFLTKPFNDTALLGAVGHALDQSRAALLHDAEMRTLRERHASLTRRETQVMALVVSGLPNKLVGDRLGISEVTVKAHRGQMMKKMRAASLAGLVTLAATLGLAPAPIQRN
jgi:FixJ family two-component response regulator